MNCQVNRVRVWDKQRKEWVAGAGYANREDQSLFLNFDGTLSNKYGGPTDQNRFAIQRCTGLKDSKGKLIFEGDYVRFEHVPNSNCLLHYSPDYSYMVKWHIDEAAFVIADSCDPAYFNRMSDVLKLKVLGNYWEDRLRMP